MPSVLTRLRLLGLTGATGNIQLAANLGGQAIGYTDTIVLNTPYLVYGDNTVLGGGGTPVGGALQIGGSPQFDMRNQPFPRTPGWHPPAVLWGNQTQTVPITSSQYLPIVVDPDTGYAEEIWLTAFVSATSTTSTWLGTRGAGASTGAPTHSSGAAVWNAPTPYDVGGAGSSALLASTVLTATQPNVVFTNIPATFNHLELRAIGQTTTTVSYWTVQFNGDTAAHYGGAGIMCVGGTGNVAGAFDAQNFFGVNASANDLSGTTAGASYMSRLEVGITDYANTSFYKAVRWTSGYANYTANTSTSANYTMTWGGTAAINQITVALGGGSFAIGSAFYLYGVY